MNITIKDIENYIEELKLQRDFMIENKVLFDSKLAPLQIEWFNKQIAKFEKGLEELK